MHIYILAGQFLSHTPLESYIKLQPHVLCSCLPDSIYNHLVTVVATSSQRGILQQLLKLCQACMYLMFLFFRETIL